VRGIAQQQHSGAHVPRRCVYGAEASLRMIAKFHRKVWDERDHVGEFRGEEPIHVRLAAERVEADWPGARQEQGDGEAAVGVGQGDQHESSARPHVQRVRRQGETASVGRHGELLVVVLERFLAYGEVPAGGKARAHGRTRAVGRDRRRERDGKRLA